MFRSIVSIKWECKKQKPPVIKSFNFDEDEEGKMTFFIFSIKRKGLKSFSIFFLTVSIFLTMVGWVMAQDTTPPMVVSSSPANGAVNVSVNLAGLSITFSEPMFPSVTYSTDPVIWGVPMGTISWSEDKTVLTFPRNPAVALPIGVTVSFTIQNLRDLAGNYLSPNPLVISFLVGTDVDLPPSIISTNPPDGTTGVSLNLQSVSITFSEPMKTSLNMTSNFPSFRVTWSNYYQVLTFTRIDTQTPLRSGADYVFNINPPGGHTMTDTQGNPLPQTTFSFRTQQEFQLLKILENPSSGFHWPYYLLIPNHLSSKTVLLVETNNTGYTTDDIAVHDAAAESLIRFRSDFGLDLDIPILVPTFPRPNNPGYVYTHALDRYSLTTTATVAGKSIQRIDLQLIAMIADARKRLAAMGYVIDKRVFMHGFSASGAFTSRFTLLHPWIVKAAAPGSPGGWPTAPVPGWDLPSPYGVTTLRYPVGIADVESLTGKPFDLQTYKRVPHYIYVGFMDNNDALDTRGIPADEVIAICAWLDCSPLPWIADRWPISESIYDSVDANAQFVVYPGVDHTITEQMFSDIKNFFNQKRHPIITNALVGPMDVDADGKADMTIYRPSTGAWYIYPSGGGAPYGFGWGGDAMDKPVAGDYDGDGKTDIAIYRASVGTWYVYPSGGSTPYGIGWGGDGSDKPVPGDYDGDGNTDIAVYRSGTGAWYIYPSGGSAPYGLGWGGDGSDKPVPGDYDGDGKTDIAVYRTNTGAWYVYPSGGGSPYGLGWGGDPSDKPVPGDYDGDGKTDIAVYRTNSGAWYVRPSSGASPYGVGWGGDPSDKPVPGDYDGDGKTDIAVYRAGTGAWYIYPSGGSAPYGLGWGGSPNDIPVTMNLAAMD